MTKENKRPTYLVSKNNEPLPAAPSESSASWLVSVACLTVFPVIYLLGRIAIFLLT